jgi:hypothetical protein
MCESVPATGIFEGVGVVVPISVAEMVLVEHAFNVMTEPPGRLTTAPRAAWLQKVRAVPSSSCAGDDEDPPVSLPSVVVTAHACEGSTSPARAKERSVWVMIDRMVLL